MKIGILTQSINNNYGGILQNYALQTVLQRMGHEVVTLNWDAYRCDHAHETLWQQFWLVIKTFVWRTIMRHELNYPWEQKRFFYQLGTNNQAFNNKYLHLSEWLWGKRQFRQYTIEQNLDILIVGSDQTWRPQYNRNGILFRMYLDFANGLDVKRIAYAASFGVDTWEYSDKETAVCTKLVKAFDAVSVREENGIALCQQYLNRTDASWVLDPTLLLDSNDYIALLQRKKSDGPVAGITTYILDNTPEKGQMILSLAETKNLKVTSFSPKYCYLGTVNQQTISEYITPSVTEWLQAFYNAEYVICDSFHGTVFSIIFNKPFITIGNRNRGLGRFLSLLKQFGLKDRLVEDSSPNALQTLDAPIDWAAVNDKWQAFRQDSILFLRKAIDSNQSLEV